MEGCAYINQYRTKTFTDVRRRQRAGFGFHIPSAWSVRSRSGLPLTLRVLRMSLGLHRPVPRSNTTIEKVKIAPGVGRQWKYGWLGLIHFGGTICMLSISRLRLSSEPASVWRWNAARAFATYLDGHPQLYQDRNVIELGAGGGLPGIVAALNGAKAVRQQDL